MDWYETKRALLERLGKNPKDNKLVDRMILDWRVELREWMYYIVDKDEIIRELREEIKELKKSEPKEELNRVSSLEEELYEAKAQWEYYENLYNEEKEDKHNRIRKCFRWIKNIKPSADWEEFRDWVMDDNE